MLYAQLRPRFHVHRCRGRQSYHGLSPRQFFTTSAKPGIGEHAYRTRYNKTLPDSGMSQWAGPRGGMLTEGPARGLTCPGSRASIQWLLRWISPHGVALLSPLAFLAPR